MESERVIRLLFYLACGAMMHLVLIGPDFDWQSTRTWFVLLGWPIAWIAFVWSALMVFSIVAMVCITVALFIWRS